MRRRLAVTLGAVLLVAGLGCTGSSTASDGDDVASAPGLRVASFDFAESEILAEVYAQAAERVGVPVVRLGAVGPREVLVPAMRDGQVDMVPEYVGSALLFAGVADPPIDPSEAVELLASRVGEFDIEVLAPSDAVDSNVFVVSASTAETLGLRYVSDLAEADLQSFGGPAECPERPLCLAGLRDTYDVTFPDFVVQPSLRFTAEALRRGEIDVGVLFSTSHELGDTGLVALLDDRGLQPPENVVPLVRGDALDRWGSDLESAFDDVSQQLTIDALRVMNGRAAAGEPVDVIARDWLTAAR